MLASRAIRGHFLRGSAPLVASSVLAMVIAFIRSVVLGRELGSDLFGLLTYAVALSLFIPQLLNLQTGDTTIRFIGGALGRNEQSAAMTYLQLGLVLEAVAASIALLATGLFAFPISNLHPEHELLRLLLARYLPAVPFIMLRRPLSAALVALRRFSLAAILQVAGSLLDLGAVLLGLPGGPLSIAGFMAGSAAVNSILTGIVAVVLVQRRAGCWLGGSFRSAWHEMRTYIFAGGLLGSIKSLTSNLDVVLLGAIRPASEVGYYTLARSAAGVLSSLVAPLLQVVYPLMNEAWVEGNRAKLRRLIGDFMLINATVASSAFVFLLPTAGPLIRSLYGASFLPAARILQVLVISIGLQAVFGWMRKLLVIAGYPRLDLAAGVIGTSSFLILAVPFIVTWGALGLAVLLALNALLMIGTFAWLGIRRTPIASTLALSQGPSG